MRHNVKKMLELIDQKIDEENKMKSIKHPSKAQLEYREAYLKGLKDARDLLLNNSIY